MERRFPVPPGVVARVVRATARPGVQGSELARLLEPEPELRARILRAVGSPVLGWGVSAATVERAIALVGIRAFRNLVIALSAPRLVPEVEIAGFPQELFWAASLRRAAAAQCLAEQLGMPLVQESFTIGLCQDLGLLVRLRDDGAFAARLAGVVEQPAEARLALEREGGPGHDEVGAALFAAWSFPEALVMPVRYHHLPGSAPAEHRRQARIAAAAEALADLACTADPQGALLHAAARLRDLGLDVELLTSSAPRTSRLAAEFAGILGQRQEPQPRADEIVRVASRETIPELSDALLQQTALADELERRNHVLEHHSRTDALTRLPNHRAFDEALAGALATAHRQRGPFSLLTLELDDYDRIQDDLGRRALDAVLEAAAVLVRQAIRLSDTPARLGERTFGILLPFTGNAGGRIAAERLRNAIETGAFAWEGRPIRVTASLGGATLEAVAREDLARADDLISRATTALERAKRSGRNTCRWNERETGVGTDRSAPVG